MISGSRNTSLIKVEIGGGCTLFLLFAFILILSSCENDPKEIARVSNRKLEISVDTSKGVEAIMSDSAVVEGKLITPVMLTYKSPSLYYVMPSGLTVIFYDESMKETSRIKADHGVWREKDKLVELRKNVVVTTSKGDTFKSEELFYDENKRIFYSNQMVYVTKLDGTSFSGTQFQSDQNFNNPVFQNASGSIATGSQLPGANP